MSNSCCLKGKEQGIEDESEEQGGRLVALLLTPREDNFCRPAVGQICLIVCSGVEAPKQFDVTHFTYYINYVIYLNYLNYLNILCS